MEALHSRIINKVPLVLEAIAYSLPMTMHVLPVVDYEFVTMCREMLGPVAYFQSSPKTREWKQVVHRVHYGLSSHDELHDFLLAGRKLIQPGICNGVSAFSHVVADIAKDVSVRDRARLRCCL